MTTDNSNNAARAYAEQACYQDENRPIAEAGFRAGWKAARTHLAAQEPTAAEVEALARMTTEEVSGCDWARFGEDSRNYHRETARRRLTAARAARRDEEAR